MATNIEIKAKCGNLNEIEKIVKRVATQYLGTDFQIDTYFNTHKGRFKLRESILDGAYLIPYLRPDEMTSKKSEYDKIQVDNPQKVKELFTNILGIHCVVKKKRKIYLYENVRIHLDEVDQLGTFIELEAVYDGSPEMEIIQKQKIDQLMKWFLIKENMLVAMSYENMIG